MGKWVSLLLTINFSGILCKSTKFLGLLLLFLLISLIPYLFNIYFQGIPALIEQQLTSGKVLAVMEMYNCDNLEIYEAILATFDPVLIAVIIAVESGFRVDAISPAGCRGLMQLSPDKLENWRNIRLNIQIGAAYLETQLNHFKDLELAFAAYNAGPGAVIKYQGIPPFRETITYLERIKGFAPYLSHLKLTKPSRLTGRKIATALF